MPRETKHRKTHYAPYNIAKRKYRKGKMMKQNAVRIFNDQWTHGIYLNNPNRLFYDIDGLFALYNSTNDIKILETLLGALSDDRVFALWESFFRG